MKNLLWRLILLLAAGTAAPAAGLGTEIPEVAEIIERANLAAYYADDDYRAEVTMTISDAQGRKRERELVMLRRDLTDGGEQKFYLYFNKPGDVRGMVFMVHKRPGGEDDRWLYLPALDLVRRIAASDKRTSFVGSHFVYEDVSGRGIEEDTHELVETTDSHFLLKSTPRNPAAVEFSSYTLWIDRVTFLPVKAEYYDRQDRLYRRIEAEAVETIQDRPTIVRSRAQDLAGGGETVTEFTGIRYDLGIDDTIFTERYLRRPPAEVRR
ncbi:MAG: outer membrane lipoprotein-sorting protein [Desulfobulbaceae bacterium]|nr:outer membrane lipoprotein-sorting protein [Desulfobulbaceae bacterium]